MPKKKHAGFHTRMCHTVPLLEQLLVTSPTLATARVPHSSYQQATVQIPGGAKGFRLRAATPAHVRVRARSPESPKQIPP